ncbi:TPA: DUF2591 domain-containing protein [Enterobacter roggenkampii]|nr:DUF2591 domain-containing protein [Enterobacter roggenkampii]
MDYSQLSDFEINKRVSVAAGLNVNMFFDVDEAYARGPVWTAPSGNCYAGIKSSKGSPFDPCNDPADAWPIITENRIGIIPAPDAGKWKAAHREVGEDDTPHHFTQSDKPLRAAMIVFLQMQDANHA